MRTRRFTSETTTVTSAVAICSATATVTVTTTAMVLALVGAAGLLGTGCGKRGAPLPPLRVQATEVAELRALPRGKRILLDAPLPTQYNDGEPFQLARVRVWLRPGALSTEAPVRSAPAPPVLAPAPHSAMIADPPTGVGSAARTASVAQADAVATAPSANVAVPIAPMAAITPSAAAPNAPSAAAPVAIAGSTPVAAVAGVVPVAVVPPSAQQFLKEADRVVEIFDPAELAAAVEGGRIRVEIDAPELGGGRAAVALELFGLRSGDRGRLTPITMVRVGATPEAPPAPRVENLEGGIRVVVGASAAAPRLLFRRLSARGPMPGTPIGGKLVVGEYSDTAVAQGVTACYALSAVLDTPSDRAISALSGEACVTRKDTFAPAPPTRLQAFVTAEGVLLSWTASPAADLKGYRVYRKVDGGERHRVDGGPAVSGTSYVDSEAPKKGRRSSYQVTAIDRAEPANESAPTAWVASEAETPSYR